MVTPSKVSAPRCLAYAEMDETGSDCPRGPRWPGLAHRGGGGGVRAHVFPLAAACLLAISSPSAGQDLDWQAEALRGLDGLWVLVEDLPNPAHEGAVTRDALKTYLEMRLRKARIPVLSHHEWLASERHPTPQLSVVAIRTTPGGWAHKLSLQVKQHACIGRLEGQEGLLLPPRGCSRFMTWDVSVLSPTTEGLADSVRGLLAQLMDQLVNDYLAMNP